MGYLEDINKLTKELKTKKEKLSAELKVSFQDMVLPFLNKWKKQINCIGWVQYTPYFNDGEPCTFLLGDICAAWQPTETQKEDEDFDFDEYLEETYFPHESKLPFIYDETRGEKRTIAQKLADNPEYYAAYIAKFDSVEQALECNNEFHALRKGISAIPNDILEDVFGEHVTVNVTLEGIEVEEYDHD